MKKVFIASRFGEEKIARIKIKLIKELKQINIYLMDFNKYVVS